MTCRYFAIFPFSTWYPSRFDVAITGHKNHKIFHTYGRRSTFSAAVDISWFAQAAAILHYETGSVLMEVSMWDLLGWRERVDSYKAFMSKIKPGRAEEMLPKSSVVKKLL